MRDGIKRLGSKEKGLSYRYPGSGEIVREEKVLKLSWLDRG